MKYPMKRGMSVLLALVLVVSLFSGLTVNVHAVGVLYNQGQRGTVADEFSDAAEAFYAKNHIAYEDLVTYSGSGSLKEVPASPLYLQLQSLMKKNHTHLTSYSETRDLYQRTDCQNGGGKISSFYSGTAIGPAWDGGATWNREHTWPNSKGLGGDDENDIMMLRPTAKSENGSRSNMAYGESSDYYYPNMESNDAYDVRGDVARIALYIYTRWGNTTFMWGKTGVIESKNVLLSWMEQDPVDTWELCRNDVVQTITGTRNVYVDYPELAFLLFDEEIPGDLVTPSGKAAQQYTVTAQSGDPAQGSVTVSGNVITAIPAEGFLVDSCEVVSGTANIRQEGNVFTVAAFSDCTVRIHFAAKKPVTVSYMDNGAAMSEVVAYTGDIVILPDYTGAAPAGYTFLGWSDNQVNHSTTEGSVSYYRPGEGYYIAADTTLYALFTYMASGSGSMGVWTRVTSASQLSAGVEVVFAANGDGLVSAPLSGTYLATTGATFSADKTTITEMPEGAQTFILGGKTGAWTFRNANDQLLGTTAAKSLAFGKGTTTWTISISGGNATIQSTTSSYGKLQYNSSHPRFTTYTSSQSLPQIYMLDTQIDVPYYTTASCTHGDTEFVPAQDATCAVDGYTDGIYCYDCDFYISGHERIPAEGHRWDGLYCSVCGVLDGYGRNALATLPNADALLYAYDQIVAGVEETAASVSIYNGSTYLTTEEVSTVMEAYRRDYAGHFWVAASYSYSISGTKVAAVMPHYTFTGSELAAAKAEFEAAAAEILSGINDSMSDYEKELYLHDALASRITYDKTFSGSDIYDAYGALVNGSCVCEGYSEAFQYLLHRVNIPAYIITGSSKGVGHEWNAVQIGGKWYQVDLTWDDQEDELYHAYFNIPTSRLLEDHIIDATPYALPVCSSEDAFYFTGKDTLLQTYTAANVGALLKQTGGNVHVYIPGNVEDFLSWYNGNISAIIAAAGASGAISYGYQWLGHEVVLTMTGIEGCVHNYEAVITAPTCTDGGYTTYTCSLCGDSFVDTYVSATGHTPNIPTPTETQAQTCVTCGTVLAPATGHLCASHLSFYAYQDATCTASGHVEHYACTCGKYYEDAAATKLLANVVIPAKGHTPTVQAGYEPTCTTAGKTEGSYCVICGAVLAEQSTIPALGHNPVTDPAVEATCTTSGKTEGSHCGRCGEVLTAQETIPALGHTGEVIPAIAPTCTGTGLTEGEKCQVCGEILKVQEIIPALGHSEVIDPGKEATCQATGLTEGKHCDVCGEILIPQTVTEKLSHTEEVIPGKAPTCTATGLTEGKKCSVCGETTLAQTVIPALGHTEVIEEALAPTCTTTGLTEGSYCDVCGTTLVSQTIIPALGHSEEILPAIAPTCVDTGLTEGKKCTVCGITTVEQTVVPATGHSWSNGVCENCGTACGHSYDENGVCTNCGFGCSHDYETVITAPTCTEQGYTTYTCGICHHTYNGSFVAALGHSWMAATCVDAKTCAVCRITEGQPNGHNYDTVVTAPTCTEQGYTTHTCAVCGDSYKDAYTDAAGHTADLPVEENRIEPTCTEAGSYESVTYCAVCAEEMSRVAGTIPAKGHSYEAVVTAPTCTEQGYTTHTCHCGDTYTDSYTPALGHSYGEWEVITEATCTEAGEKKCSCHCGDTLTEVIPAKGHSWQTIDEATMECSVCGEKQSGYRIGLDPAAVADADYAFVDGKKYPITRNGGETFVSVMHTDATNLVVYTVNDPYAADIHTQYPTGMRVWMLKFEDGAYTATHIPEFDNLLQYSGSSIRIVGVKGIRMITSIDKDTRNSLIHEGLSGYKLLEYGTALAWAGDLDENNPLVLGREYTKSNFAYKRGEADPIFNRTGNLIQYTNVLVGFDDDQCIPDIVMRPYIILEDEEGSQVTVYGGEVVRNIGYIAWQNRNVFNPGNAAYDYVWNIIHHVYGDMYDEDYKG